MKIASITHLFPTELNTYQGKFIKDQFELLESSDYISSLESFISTPYTIPLTKRHINNSSSFVSNSLKPKRISYLSFPKKKCPKIIKKSISKSFTKKIASKKYDLIHVHFLYPSGLVIPALKKIGFKTILTIHGGDYYRIANSPKFEPIIHEIFSSSDKILLVGPTLVNDLKEKYPLYKAKYFQINNVVDEDIYTIPSIEDKIFSKQDLNWDTEKKHFLCIANNRPEKGLDILYQTSLKLKDLTNKIKIHVIGGLEDEFSEFGFKRNSILNIIPPQDPLAIVKYYHASDGYLFPSRKEGFGLSMIEAASTGLPILGNPAGIAPNFINKDIGILNYDFNVNSFELKFRELLTRLKSYNPTTIRENTIVNFGKKKFLKNMVSVYEQVIEQ